MSYNSFFLSNKQACHVIFFDSLFTTKKKEKTKNCADQLSLLAISLVKHHYFQLAFLENCIHKKQKKSIKDQRNFCSNAFFKVFANFVSALSKIWCLCFSNEQNNKIFFISPVGHLPEIKECLFSSYNGVQFIPL